MQNFTVIPITSVVAQRWGVVAQRWGVVAQRWGVVAQRWDKSPLATGGSSYLVNSQAVPLATNTVFTGKK